MTSRLIYGFHAVISKLRHDPESIKEILIDATRQDARARDLLKHAELQGTRVIATDGKRLDGMAPDGKHQGVVARIEGGRKVLAALWVVGGLATAAMAWASGLIKALAGLLVR